jgi:hypothetical protein
LGRGNVEDPENGHLKFRKGKVQVKILDKVGIHIEESGVGSVHRGDVLARIHRFEYDAFLVKIPGDIMTLPKLRYTLSTLVY